MQVEGVPLTELMTVKTTPSGPEPVIVGADVNLNGAAMKLLTQLRDSWAVSTALPLHVPMGREHSSTVS